MRKILAGCLLAGCLMAGDKKPKVNLKAQVAVLVAEVQALKAEQADLQAALLAAFGDQSEMNDMMVYALKDLNNRVRHLEHPFIGKVRRPGVQEHASVER